MEEPVSDPSDINAIARKLREGQAAQKAAYDSWRHEQEAAQHAAEEAENRHAAEVLSLCEKFHRWAVKNRVPKTPHEGGWMLGAYEKWSDSQDTWYPFEYRMELWVMSNGKVRINHSGRSRLYRPESSYLQVFTLDDIRRKIAEFVNISGKAWDE